MPEVTLILVNDTAASLSVVVEPFFSRRTIEWGRSVECSLWLEPGSYVGVARSRLVPSNGVWLHPSPGAAGRFVPTTDEDLIGVQNGSTRRRRDAWPLAPRESIHDALGLFIDDDASGAVLTLPGEASTALNGSGQVGS